METAEIVITRGWWQMDQVWKLLEKGAEVYLVIASSMENLTLAMTNCVWVRNTTQDPTREKR